MKKMEQETSLSSFPETDGPASTSSSISVCYEIEEMDEVPLPNEHQTTYSYNQPASFPPPRPHGPTSSVLWCELSQLARRIAQLKFRMQQVPEGPQRAKLVAQFDTLSQTKRAIKHMLGPVSMRVESLESPCAYSRPR
jgi:hypothetical protein